MAERILSISGLRGVIGDGLDPAYATQFAMALGTLCNGGRVVLARDGRSTGLMFKHAVLSGLMATGCEVLDLDIASTPTCGVMVRKLNAAGGLQITASHNPIEWNGLKPFGPLGSVFDAAQGARLVELLSTQAFALKPWSQLGLAVTVEGSGREHLDDVLKLIDASRVSSRGFRVVLDCNRGSGAVLGPELLRRLNCQIEVRGGTPDGQFEHPAEPLKENLTSLSDAVVKGRADVGFAQDPDADRLAIVDETGRYIGEELTLALAADYLLARSNGPVVVNGSTSRVTADIAQKYGRPFHRSAVGEANVVSTMRAVNAVLGGEGNGGVIEPRVGYVRDSFAGMAYVLAGLAERGGTLSSWVDSLPSYAIIKDKLHCPRDRVDKACAALRSAYRDAAATEGDGLRLDWPDRWVQVRASNTEPILRVIAEAPGDAVARQLCSDAMDRVRAAVKD